MRGWMGWRYSVQRGDVAGVHFGVSELSKKGHEASVSFDRHATVLKTDPRLANLHPSLTFWSWRYA